MPAVLNYDNAEFGPGHLCDHSDFTVKTIKAIVLSMRSFLRRIKCVHCCLLYPLLFQRPWLKEDATDALCGGEKKQASFEIRVKRRKEEKKGGDALTCCTQRAGEVLQRERRGEVREEWCDQGKGGSVFFFFYRVGWREREKKSGRWLDGPQHTKGHALHCNCCARRRLGFSPQDNNPHSLLLF